LALTSVKVAAEDGVKPGVTGSWVSDDYAAVICIPNRCLARFVTPKSFSHLAIPVEINNARARGDNQCY
jgi:hypothetical protein